MWQTILLNSLILLGLPAILIVIMRWFGEVIQAETFRTPRLVWLLMPGVVIHELSHLLMCYLFGLHVEQVKLFHYDADTGNLGFVKYDYRLVSIKDRIGVAFVGFAPIIGITLIEYGIYAWLFPHNLTVMSNQLLAGHWWRFFSTFFSMHPWTHLLLFLIISAFLLSGYALSAEDLQNVRIGLPFLILLSVLLMVGAWYFPWIKHTLFLGLQLMVGFCSAILLLCQLIMALLRIVI